MAGLAWTQQEDQFLRDNIEKMSCAEIAEGMGRTTRAVQHRFGVLGLERSQPKLGDRFGRLVIVELFTKQTPTQKQTMARVKCDCGQERAVRRTWLAQGKQTSCGCWKAEKASERMTEMNTSHGQSETRLYRIWAGMRARCKYDTQSDYHNYGGRGVTVCQEWDASFEVFAEWARSTQYAEGLEIDRKDVNGHYTPDNCRWVERKVQQRNKRTNTRLSAFGEEKTMIEWSEDPRCAVSYQTIVDRLGKLGWDSVEQAITTPSRFANKVT